MKIPKGAEIIINILEKNGYEAYVVGGCVRDSILGREPQDWDITTSATPQQMKELFHKTIDTGIKHGTITICIDGEYYETTTYRIDGEYEDGRHPKSVIYTTSLEEDLKRRDFTINAMAYNPTRGLIDLFGGIKDIENKIIRCVGDANERFSEDALRILRAMRFAGQLGYSIHENTSNAIMETYSKLERISPERIREEICKMIITKSFSEILQIYKEVFSYIIPEISHTINFIQNNPWHIYNVFNHTVVAIENSPKDIIIRLAILFHDIGKPHAYQDDEDGVRHFKGHPEVSVEMTEKILRRLKFDNKTRENTIKLIRYHDAEISPTKKCIKRWLNRIGEDQLRRLLEVKRADNLAQNQILSLPRINEYEEIKRILDEVLRESECFTLKDLTINGRDLMELGVESGPQMGKILNELLNAVIEERVENERVKLLKFVDTIKHRAS